MKYTLKYGLGQLKFDIKIQLEDILRLSSTGEDNDETRLAERSSEINDIIGKLYLRPSETKKKKSNDDGKKKYKSKYDKNRIKDILTEDELKVMEQYVFSFESGNNKLFKEYWADRKKTEIPLITTIFFRCILRIKDTYRGSLDKLWEDWNLITEEFNESIYKSQDEINGYHNGICSAQIGANANIHVTIVNLLNTKINNFYSVNSNIEDESKTLFSMVEFGGKYNVVNYYAKLAGYKSVNKLHSIYLGKEEQKIDLNYITELYGEKTNVDIEVNGALKDKARKNFKGTIDFKTGSKKAKGKENEYCTLLSDTSYSKALPMLLCTEDDVEGEHSTATGKVDENELFYIMTRGISEKEAKKMIVKAKFNSVIQGIKEETVQNLILEEVDRRLD